MILEPVTYTLPAYWASYLINGDASGIDDTEQKQADNFLTANNLPSPVSCSDETYFSHSNDAGTLPGDVLEYTFLIPQTTAYFERFTIELPLEAIADCSHIGRCDEDVAHWANKIARPESVTPEKLAAELKEFGAWDAAELADDSANWKRIIWIAACNIKEEKAEPVTA